MFDLIKYKMQKVGYIEYNEKQIFYLDLSGGPEIAINTIQKATKLIENNLKSLY